MHRIVSLAALILASTAACGGSQEQQKVKLVPEGTLTKIDARSAPEWVLRTPRMKGNVCAVGAVDPTFYRQDGLTRSAEAARNELARTVQVKISSVMYDEQTVRGSHVDEVFVQEIIGSISDVVLSGAEVLEYWYDERGAISRRGMTYALACMSTDQSAAQLAEKLKMVAPETPDREQQLAEVRERAASAFDELEAQEEKKLGGGGKPVPEAPQAGDEAAPTPIAP